MQKSIGIIVSLFLILISISVSAKQKTTDYREFERQFLRWTHAFNHKDLAASCRLFSPRVIADYQGFPSKNYDSICNGFKKIFADPTDNYQYSFKLHNVYRSGDLAALRITWYLKHYEGNKLHSVTQDEGIDILQLNNTGEWKIVNYIAYGKEMNGNAAISSVSSN